VIPVIASASTSLTPADIGCLVIAVVGVLIACFPRGANRVRLLIPGQGDSPVATVRVLGVWGAIIGVACLLLLVHSGK